MTAADVFRFIWAWTGDPVRLGSIVPSGAALSDAMTAEIGADTGPVLELGPGTGVFTAALLRRGVPERNITLIEYGSDFVRLLQVRFPRARVLWMDAAHLARHRLYDGAPVGAVVSGLPMLNLTPRKMIAILSGAFGYLRPDGAFYQFTYGPTCPVPRPVLDRLGLKAVMATRVLPNVPPAAVYRLTRRGPRRPV
ncbi:methyltransferase domain-containing protein [Rhodoplanes serenus]|uniref:Methyltransferase domain-containing protein n=1 Tax=Rhodoplanes serenus TaxID=200615 RepID=A0A9X4XMH3_9BRAD|nr:methyltransferase domain-containing protein [Rhodoplanes serenus]MTW17362.1 methyltransferase domain-containing protein [Rhodoplanes serenus]